METLDDFLFWSPESREIFPRVCLFTAWESEESLIRVKW